MRIAFLIAIHLLLISIYALLIETHHSRLNYGHLLFALFFPFVGEFCLLACELGKSPANVKDRPLFLDFSEDVESKNAEAIEISKEVSREELLKIISDKPSNLVEILKTTINSKDIEVVHISAATLMKLKRDYENKIKEAKLSYENMPNNMSRLANYIFAIDEYNDSTLLEGDYAKLLLEERDELLEKYLNVLPDEKDFIASKGC